MKAKTKFTRLLLTLSHSQWLQPAMLTLVVAIVLAGVTGCQPSHH